MLVGGWYMSHPTDLGKMCDLSVIAPRITLVQPPCVRPEGGTPTLVDSSINAASIVEGAQSQGQ